MRIQLPLWRVILLGLLALATPLEAQVKQIVSQLTVEDTAAPLEKPEETEARLQQWLKETRTAFSRISEPSAETQLPTGIDTAALADYRQDLEQSILAIHRHLKIFATIPEARKALEAARAADAAWTGFDEKPPYSLLLTDELINQQEAIKEKAASYHSSLELFGRTLAGIQEEARRDENTAQDASEDGAADWRLTARRAKSRLLALRATFLQSNAALLRDQAQTAQLQLSLLDRQITLAKKKPSFSEADLAKVKKAAADRQAALHKEEAAIRKRQQDTTAAKVRAQAVLDQLLKATPAGTPLQQTPELALATVKLEAAETRVDALQFVAEALESANQLETMGSEIYQNRKNLLDSNIKAIREPALQSLRTSYDRLKSWEIVVTNELAAVNADISKQESRATSIAAEDPRLAPINEIRAALWDKLAIMQRVSQSVSAQRRMLQRWLDEWDNSNMNRPLAANLSEATASAWSYVKRIWKFQVFQYDDTVMIGGIPITEKRGVALGQFFYATLFFSIAYFISTRINNRMRNAVVRRGHLAEPQAKTLGNWLMIVVGFLLAVATLHFLKIPLTVFAFFGGALAIGLGFGTQTLIKNFISGIIVLFERKIRVGDIVDVSGVTGSITEINTRSSVLRSADGRETLVPNSEFLEKQVTNLTLSNRRFRHTLRVRVALDSAPQAVGAILKECVDRHGLVLKQPEPFVTFDDFADNAHVFAIYFWTEFNDKTDSDIVASDIRFMIEKHFAESGIEFPSAMLGFPYHIKTNITAE